MILSYLVSITLSNHCSAVSQVWLRKTKHSSLKTDKNQISGSHERDSCQPPSRFTRSWFILFSSFPPISTSPPSRIQRFWVETCCVMLCPRDTWTNTRRRQLRVSFCPLVEGPTNTTTLFFLFVVLIHPPSSGGQFGHYIPLTGPQ